jgi:hypothetical protein
MDDKNPVNRKKSILYIKYEHKNIAFPLLSFNMGVSWVGCTCVVVYDFFTALIGLLWMIKIGLVGKNQKYAKLECNGVTSHLSFGVGVSRMDWI